MKSLQIFFFSKMIKKCILIFIYPIKVSSQIFKIRPMKVNDLLLLGPADLKALFCTINIHVASVCTCIRREQSNMIGVM